MYCWVVVVCFSLGLVIYGLLVYVFNYIWFLFVCYLWGLRAARCVCLRDCELFLMIDLRVIDLC